MNLNPSIQPIRYLSSTLAQVDILRLDQIHPIVSGNKWYKLRYYIQDAIDLQATYIASFGGPYSNHLVALAFTAKQNNIPCIGYVRSSEGEPITPTLQEALNYGMELVFVGRDRFKEKKDGMVKGLHLSTSTKIYYIDEGGYGILGAKGAATILSGPAQDTTENSYSQYDYIVCAVGTGTMIAGIINASYTNQKVIGISVLKNAESIADEIKTLLLNPSKDFTLLHEFHQGGYAKTTPAQIEFMNTFWEQEKIPTDIVYTGKAMFAVDQLVQANYFKPGSKILVIHSGGLQGNRSMKPGVLQFD